MDDIISRQAAIDALKDAINDSVVLTIQGDMYSHDDNYFGLWVALSIIQKLPSAQPERKTGKWILDENPHDGDCRCSVCLTAINQMHERNHGLLNALTGEKWWTFYNFCPNCGARMGGDNT